MIKFKFPSIILIAIIFILFLTFFSCEEDEDSQTTKDPQIPEQQELTEQQKLLVQELNQWLIPLASLPLDLTDIQLSFLNQLSNAKVVALGEATHGTKDFFQMKHRIFRYLVENCQHKAFGFEADFAESLYLDEYICNGEGDLLELMKTKMHFWTWKTQEVKQLLEWMKDYNIGRSEEEKIHYYGFDCQFLTYQPEFIQKYLEITLPSLWDTVAPVLEQVKNIPDNNYKNMIWETFDDTKTQLESLENRFIENKDQLIANSSSKEYEIHKQLLNTFKQTFIVKYRHAQEDQITNWRDMYMAENALWIADFLGQDAKVTLWAHNGHVANDWIGWGRSMGAYLKENLDNLYQIVGFSFSKGSFTAVGQDQQGNYTGLRIHEITEEPLRDSINYIFHHASQPNFVFHLEDIMSGSEWDKWLSNPRPFLSIGSMYNGVPRNYYLYTNIKNNYSWIIHFDQTSASKLLPRY